MVTRDGLTIASVWSKPALSNVTDFLALLVVQVSK